MILTCECCGFSREFATGEEAFRAGWDAPPHFTQFVTCNLCPASFLALGIAEKHRAVHEKWARDGRPDEFEWPEEEEREAVT
jgi:hypothetical protein